MDDKEPHQKILLTSVLGNGDIITEDFEPSQDLEEDEIYGRMLQSWKITQRNTFKNKKQPTTTDTQNESLLQTFNHFTDQTIKYQKAKFIMEDLIEPIQQSKLLDLSDNKVIQFMHLLCFRAWCDINSALNSFGKSFTEHNQKGKIVHSGKNQDEKNGNRVSSTSQNKSIISSIHDENLKTIIDPMYQLFSKIQKVFQFYFRSLSFREKSLRKKLKSVVNAVFQNQQSAFREKILFGVQEKDFTRLQQISYTQTNLIPSIRKRLLNASESQKCLKMREALQAYPKIMRIEMGRINSYEDFNVVKQTIIKEEQLKLKAKINLIY